MGLSEKSPARTPGTKAFIIAGTHSGCGKTTVSLGIMAALSARGFVVQPYKCGPDFIDPTLHREICGRMSRNLDIRMCGEDWTRATFHRHLGHADIAVVEGVMGLFDGGAGSAAALAKFLGIPVILVVDVQSRAESVAAEVRGFSDLDPEVEVAGVICNRAGSKRHRQLIKTALRKHCRVPLIGFLPREEKLALPSRHLGLAMGHEAGIKEKKAELTRWIEAGIDLDLILAGLSSEKGQGDERRDPLPGTGGGKIAVARDRAFCFYYQDNLDLLAAAGADLVFFSPLADSGLPAGTEILYLGGGYPELFAAELTANRRMREEIRKFCLDGGRCLAECGGFMYLCGKIRDLEGREHSMAGVFPTAATMDRRLRSLGYRAARLRHDCFLGRGGDEIRGHEFHYSTITPMAETVERIYDLGDRMEGFRIKNTIGSYIHLHFGSNPAAARAMVEKG